MSKKKIADEKKTISTKENKDSLEQIMDEVETLKKNESDAQNAKENEVREEKILKLENEKKELEEKFLRVNADLQNIRRRSDTDRMRFRQEGSKDVLKPILSAIDDFSRAFENIPQELQENSFVQGIQSIEKNLLESITGLGVEFFGGIGDDFDAEKHESMMIDPNAEPGKISQVFEKGVMFRGSILRHAKVSAGN